MKLSDFNIEFIKFKNDTHNFTYKLSDTFFGLKLNSLYQNCDIDVQVLCKRNENNISLDYVLDGFVHSTCERCLEDIKLELKSSRNEVLRLTSNDELLEEENYLSVNHQIYNTYDSIYEEICLSMPTRKICKLSLNQQECEIDHQETAQNEDVVDDRWAELKKLIK